VRSSRLKRYLVGNKVSMFKFLPLKSTAEQTPKLITVIPAVP
jgi:hypothetical protein